MEGFSRKRQRGDLGVKGGDVALNVRMGHAMWATMRVERDPRR